MVFKLKIAIKGLSISCLNLVSVFAYDFPSLVLIFMYVGVTLNNAASNTEHINEIPIESKA